MDNNGVAERIKFLMKELNYRQVDFAQKIDIDTSNLSKYLNGRLAMSEALIMEAKPRSPMVKTL